MRNREPNDFRRIVLLASLILLCSCNSNLFGPDSREIAGGYCLKKIASANQFSLTIPHETGGMIVDEIGWREPFIVARSSGSEYWEVINTARAEHDRVSDHERKSDPRYQSIPILPAGNAWDDLSSNKRLW